jgi:hypothetical protein
MYRGYLESIDYGGKVGDEYFGMFTSSTHAFDIPAGRGYQFASDGVRENDARVLSASALSQSAGNRVALPADEA